jgi:hypothetical protein
MPTNGLKPPLWNRQPTAILVAVLRLPDADHVLDSVNVAVNLGGVIFYPLFKKHCSKPKGE